MEVRRKLVFVEMKVDDRETRKEHVDAYKCQVGCEVTNSSYYIIRFRILDCIINDFHNNICC